MCLIRFGGEASDYLALTIHDRSLPESTDYWDGNWLVCTAEVAAGAFRGSLDRLIRNEDLARFLAGVERLYTASTGEAILDTLEGWLDLRLIRDRSGHVEARGQLCDDPVIGNTLEFRLFRDQTDLPPLIAQLRAALAMYPVVGEPRQG